jgi:hypothetical protein
MESTPGSIAIIFWVVLLLVITHPSYQYTYSCSSSAACGCSANSASLTKIVGGEGAGTNTWGWAVSIYINSSSLCGGSILSSSWVVTAAHCLSAGYLPSQVSVYAGSTTRFSGTLRTASSITVHPSYNPSTKANDIALIQLSSPLTISGSISVICMPTVSAATLSAGEWPAAGLYVIILCLLFFFVNTNRYYLIGFGCRMGYIIGKWFITIKSSTSNRSNNCCYCIYL